MPRSWAWTLVVILTMPIGARAQLEIAPTAPPAASWPRFECEDGRCPPGVGALLTFRRGGEAGFCTATLIAPDRVVTAAHCVTESMHFFLPDEHAITIAWRAIIGVVHREGRSRGADHAILRLDRALDVPTPAIARIELTPDSRWEIVRASAHSDRTVFVGRERCLVMPQALSARRIEPRAIVRIAGCTIVPGSSGAPMLDARGRVVAVVSSALAPPGVAIVLAPWLTGPAPFVGTISSLACLPAVWRAARCLRFCARISRAPDLGLLPREEARVAATSAQREALAERLIAWETARPSSIDWALERHVLAERTVGVPVPGCIDVAALERAGRIDRQGRFTVRTMVPAWEAIAFLGSDLRMVPRTQRIARVRMSIRGRFDAARSRATVRVRAPSLQVPLRAQTIVPACR